MNLPKRNKIDQKKKLELKYKEDYKFQNKSFKPIGFWYSCYNSWYDWIIQEGMFDFLYKYIHEITLNRNILTDIKNKDKNKLLVINNIKDFDTFDKKYRHLYIDSKKNKYNFINWDKVAKDYGGIEICPFLKKKKSDIIYNMSWYDTWDVASGCIWNIESIIKNTKLIYEKKGKKYIKI